MPMPVRIYVGSSQVKKVVRDGVTLYQYAAKFAASTGNAKIFYSDDGKTWREANVASSLAATHRAIIRGGWKYISVASSVVSWSDDGINWHASNIAGNGSVLDVSYGNNRFVIVGENSAFFYSDDGKTWIDAGVPPPSAKKVCFDGTRFVAYKHVGQVVVSADGNTWTNLDTGSVTPYGTSGIAYGNGTYVMAANGDDELYYSSNLVNWTRVSTGNGWRGLKFLNGIFFAYTTDLIAKSQDGMTWSLYELGGKWCSMIFSGGVYRAYDIDGKTATSPDGTNWSLGGVIDIPSSNKDLILIATKE